MTSPKVHVGTLFIVATPIGNLRDMTFRAVDTLREVALIAAEDTRQTRKLLSHFEIHTRLVSYHEHNKEHSGPELIRLMNDGHSVALVSDAGMPAIADPGEQLVKIAIENHIPVTVIPGANAAISGLVMSGLSTQTFKFVGFLPRELKLIDSWMDKHHFDEDTTIFYESPHRLAQSIARLASKWAERRVAVVKELTKKHEFVYRGTLEEVNVQLQSEEIRGEFCVIIEGYRQQFDAIQLEDSWWDSLTIHDHIEHYVSRGAPLKSAMKQVAIDRQVSRREIYQHYIEHK